MEATSRAKWDSWARWILPIAAAAALGIVTAIALVKLHPASMPFDDALNAGIPTWHEVARQIASGQLPILTTRSFQGGNFATNIANGEFHPLLLGGTLLTLVFSSPTRVIVGFGAASIAVVALGGYVLGRQLGLRRSLSAFLGFTVGMAPLLLYMYVGNWGTGAAGSASLVWSTAMLIRAVRRPGAWNLLLLAGTVFTVMLSGWPNAWLSFAIIAVVTAVVALTDRTLSGSTGRSRLSLVARVGSAIALGGIVALPQITEYLANSSLFSRSARWSDTQNTAVPNLSLLFGFPLPTASDWWNWFDYGYSYWAIPFGFVSLIGIVAVFFVRWRREMLRGTWFRWALVLLVAFAVCCELPYQVASMVMPFRFLPVFGLFAAVLIALLLEYGEFVWSPKRVAAAATALAIATAYFVFRIPVPAGGGVQRILESCALAMGVIVLLVALRSVPARRWILVVLAIGGSAFVLAVTPAIGTSGYLRWTTLPIGTDLKAPLPASDAGFVLHVGADGIYQNGVWDGYWSSRYLLSDVPILNGYDPVGQRAFAKAMRTETHGLVSTKAIDFLSEPSSSGTGCKFDDYRVSSVITLAGPVGGKHAELEACGFALVATHAGTALFHKVQPLEAGTVSTASAGIELSSPTLVSELDEKVHVTASGSDGVVNFARMWWPGYSATLDGRQLVVSATDGMLVTVHIPAGAEGTVELRYWPSTWHWALPVAFAALAALLVLAIGVGLIDRRRPAR
ncbi:hypothetical protein [Gryllotalpicola sp.]|uniref:hypothetical protein n=1 Tax=Gryllotalpicola sp. TaxID=1932787 RepID=UPI0026038634|nr:hypothetical protein [Gryllotalpicola sp.]